MDGKRHFGMLNLVILNFGQTIYEKFKYPNEDSSINFDCLAKMKELSDSFKSRNIFKKRCLYRRNIVDAIFLARGSKLHSKRNM